MLIYIYMYGVVRLGSPEISVLLSSANTELKCAVLGNLVVEEPVFDSELQSGLRDVGAFKLLDAQIRPLDLGRIADKFPDPVCTASKDDETGLHQSTKQSLVGTYATALAGGLLGLSLDTNTSLRTLIGESRRCIWPANTYNDAIINRLTILTLLFQKAKNGRWIREMDLRDACEEYGIGIRGVINNVDRLSESGILDIDKQQKVKKIRFKKDTTFVEPVEVVERYLDIVANFAVGDRAAQESGLSRMDAIIHNKTVMPLLIKRAFASTAHTGKKTKS